MPRKFEYMTVKIKKRGEAEDILNPLGKEGWEAVGVVPSVSEVSNSFHVVLKREIEHGLPGFKKPD